MTACIVCHMKHCQVGEQIVTVCACARDKVHDGFSPSSVRPCIKKMFKIYVVLADNLTSSMTSNHREKTH